MIFLLLGVFLLVLVLRDVFQTVVVPRGKVHTLRFAPILVRQIVWPFIRLFGSRIQSPVWKAEILGLFGPFILVLLLTVWISLIICGFGLISFSLAKQYTPPLDSFVSALYLAGSYVMTVGSSDYVSRTTAARFLTVAAAFTGMLVTAMVVSLLFTLISSIQRREVLVSIASNIAGSAPSGITVLETHAWLNGQHSLRSFYDGWHAWCADVRETHVAYPLLLYFRSTDPFTSWLTALGAALDSAALMLSTDFEGDHRFATQLMYRSGITLLNELVQGWRIEATSTSDLISADEFHEVYVRLQQSGYSPFSEERARTSFQKLRSEYIGAHRSLCDYFSVPQTPLISNHKFPRVDLSA